MKLLKHRLFQRMLSNKGYTIDQTILIVAIIAILITLIIVTVGWQLINRTTGTKIGAQFKQVEDANGQFFSAQRVWPHQSLATGNTQSTAMAVLINNNIPPASWATNISQKDLRNLLPGFKPSGTGTAATVAHNFGSGGLITQQANRLSTAGTDIRMVVQFASVPLADAIEADMVIDGAEGYNTGRLIYGAAACLNTTVNGASSVPTTQPTSGNVFVCYGGNTVG